MFDFSAHPAAQGRSLSRIASRQALVDGDPTRRQYGQPRRAAVASLPTLNWAGFTAMWAVSWCWGRSSASPPASASLWQRRVRGGGQRPDPAGADVHAFPGHIACDAASQSELVVPVVGWAVVAVIDLDSPETARFDEEDAPGLRLWPRPLPGRLSVNLKRMVLR
jgi:GAF domain-containing protein